MTTSTVTAPVYGSGTPAGRETAKELRKLAERPELAARGRQLETLALSLEDAEHSAVWRGMPLRTVFADAVTPPSGETAPGWLRALGVLRLVLVFAPVGLTWLFIHQAANAYRARLDANPDLPAQSFFREWLTGFGGTSVWTFDLMALSIVVSVSVLVGVWLFVEFKQRGHDRRADETTVDLEIALTDAELHLSGPRGATTDVAEGLKEAAGMIDDLLRRRIRDLVDKTELTAEAIRDVGEKIKEAAKTVGATALAVQKSADETSAAADRIRDASQTAVDRLAAVAENVAESVGGFQSALQNAIRDYQSTLTAATRTNQDELTKAIGAYRGEVNERLREISGTLGDLRNALEQDRDLSGVSAEERLRNLQASFAGHIERVIEPMLARQAEQNAQALDRLGRQLAALQQPLATLQGSIYTLANRVPPEQPRRGIWPPWRRRPRATRP